MVDFKIKLAGHIWRIVSRFEESRAFFSDYITDEKEKPVLTSFVSDETLSATAAAFPELSESAIETTELYRPIANALPSLGGFVFHGAAVSYGGKGYIFTAPSGTGKSTHIRLWRKNLGKAVGIINGDKPIITVKDGMAFVHGTPWAGKERWQKNISLPLGGVCLLRRGETCSAGKAEIAEELPFLLGQIHIPKDEAAAGMTMELLDGLLSAVPLSYLYCDISEDAVKCSFEALTGLDYEKERETL